MPLTIEIVTPEAKVYSETIESVVIPTVRGEIEILPGHVPLLAQVEPGDLRITKGVTTEWLAVGDGFAQIDGDVVRVLAENAITETKIDETTVKAALERAKKEIQFQKGVDPQQMEHLQGLVRYAGVQLAIKRRRC